MRAGIGFVPEDRRQQGLVMDLSIARNTSLTQLGSLRQGRPDPLGRRERAGDGTGAPSCSSSTTGSTTPSARCPGGNQQKVVLAKWLATNPKLLIVDEPTRGIDVGTKAEVHRLLSELAGQGLAVLMISSELPEVLGMADRVLVMYEGRLTAELSRAEADEESVIRAATGQLGRGRRMSAARRRRRPRAPDDRAGVPRPRAGHRARARRADRGHRNPGAAVPRGRLAAQPRAQRIDLRHPRRRPDARADHPQRRPVGRLGARAERLPRRRPAVQASRACRFRSCSWPGWRWARPAACSTACS